MAQMLSSTLISIPLNLSFFAFLNTGGDFLNRRLSVQLITLGGIIATSVLKLAQEVYGVHRSQALNKQPETLLPYFAKIGVHYITP
jgi:uncharacterized membrane protein